MNILITLPKHLIEKILTGEKKYEMRKSLPKYMRFGEDGFFVVERGTDIVRCWCRVDNYIECKMSEIHANDFSSDLCVSPQFILEYAPVGTSVFLWGIGKVIELQDVTRNALNVFSNPQNFSYCYSNFLSLYK